MSTHIAAALPHKKRALRGRRLVVVDIENVVGGVVLGPEQALSARRSIAASVGLTGADHVVIGTSHVGLLATGLGWRGPRIVVRSGANGADLALLEVLTEERVEERFDDVVLVSGDGIFTEVVAKLASLGVRVTVAARVDAFSRRLRLGACRTVDLNDSAIGFGGAA